MESPMLTTTYQAVPVSPLPTAWSHHSGLRVLMPSTISPAGTPTCRQHAANAIGFPMGFDTNEVRPFLCPEPGCFLRFKRKFTLSEHAKTHTGEKPFVCPVKACGKSFTTSGNLSRHKRLHPWLKPQVCWVDGCGQSFTNELKFERHMKKHFRSPNERHYCSVQNCGKAFTTLGNLTRHMKQRHASSHARTPKCATLAQCHASGSKFDREIASVCERFCDIDCESFEHASLTPMRQAAADPGRGFSPLMGEISDVKDEELLDVLQCLFEDATM